MNEETGLTRIVPPHLTLLAFSPADMAAAQADLVAWGQQKVAAEQARLAEIEGDLAKARSNKWGWKAWQAQAVKQAKIVSYYRKLLRAFEAGYLVIPDFPINAFAIRTNKARPVAMETTSAWGERHTQSAAILPAREGRYVSPDPVVYQSERSGAKPGERVTWYYAEAFREATFPARLVKPEIVAMTERALALRIFDEVGLVGPPRKADPIIVGRVLDPRGPAYARPRKGVSFFICWWMDLGTL